MSVNDVLTWVMDQKLDPGETRELVLPPRLAAESVTGKVDAAHLADGRHVVLVKTQLMGRGNFAGVLASSRGLEPGEWVPAGSGEKSYVTLPADGVFEELYVHGRNADGSLDVHFDLY